MKKKRKHSDEKSYYAKAIRLPNSPYADFMMAVRGYDIIRKQNGKKVMKCGVWNLFKDRPSQLRQVVNRNHPLFDFVENENLNFKA